MSHLTGTGKHPKYEFQVERLAFFSDAVFAIAITLLVIEFKVPHISAETTYAEALQELKKMIFPLMGTILSFILISVSWVRHHILFKYIHNYNKPILRTSLFMLLPIILFPFTTAFYTESTHSKNTDVFLLAVQLFLVNNIIVGIVTFYLYWLVTNKYPDMAYPMEEQDRQVFRYRLFWVTIGMSSMFLLSFISVPAIPFGLLPIVGSAFYTRYQKRINATKAKQTHAR
jgi:uncharacterized membrane protein